MLQRFEFVKVYMGKTVIDIIADILIFLFCNKNDCSFIASSSFLLSSRFSARSEAFKRIIALSRGKPKKGFGSNEKRNFQL